MEMYGRELLTTPFSHYYNLLLVNYNLCISLTLANKISGIGVNSTF